MAGRTSSLHSRALALAGLIALTGCGGFFVKEPSGGGGGGGGGTTTGNFTYVVNTAANSVTGFSIGTATLTTVPNMPYALGYTPQSAVVSQLNNFLYLGGPGAIYAYAIGSDGSLTIPAIGAAVVVGYALSMDVSPDGNWLVALDGASTLLNIYQINKTTGALVLNTSLAYAIPNAQVIPKMVKVSPDGGLIFAALGTGGDLVFTFNTTTGTAIQTQALAPISTQTSENALAVDSTTTHLFIARSGTSGGLAVYTIGNAGLLTPVAGTPFATGAQPLAVALANKGTFAYVANGTDGTVSGYSVANGVPTALSGSPYVSGASVQSLALDRTGAYLLATSFAGSPDLTMYSFDTAVAGKLVKTAGVSTATAPAGALVVAVAH